MVMTVKAVTLMRMRAAVFRANAKESIAALFTWRTLSTASPWSLHSVLDRLSLRRGFR